MADDDLDRFLSAQARDYPTALRELLDGHKRSHWIWYIFPQMRGLGRSERARVYGLADLDEARAYLAHPRLGLRLCAAMDALLFHADQSAEAMLGDIDAAKLCSCATLFHLADPAEPLFAEVLEHFFDGQRCALTVAALG